MLLVSVQWSLAVSTAFAVVSTWQPTASLLAEATSTSGKSHGVAFQAPLMSRVVSRETSLFSSSKTSNVELEDQLLACIDRRLSNSDEITVLVQELEQTPSIPQPAIAPEIYGKWRLVHTTNADTSSPIQRKAVDSIQFPIYQDVHVNENNQLMVSQVVRFGDNSELRVDALASTSAYPLAELTERKSTGRVLGLNILGVSLVGSEAEPDPNKPDSRINFVFDEGKFDLLGGAFQIPYPAPFRNPLFRDWVKGWIDITYLSDRVRISRGNKGTTFVLVKED